MTIIRVNKGLVDEANNVLGAKSGTEAVHVALRESVARRRFKQPMKKSAGKLRFAAYEE